MNTTYLHTLMWLIFLYNMFAALSDKGVSCKIKEKVYQMKIVLLTREKNKIHIPKWDLKEY